MGNKEEKENKEQPTTEEYIISHIDRVKSWISRFATILYSRGIHHDESKLQEPEYSLWKKMDEEPRYPYGTQQYKDKLERHKKVFKLHYRKNRHHPEHWNGWYSEMDLVDMIEMMCDWLGYKENISLSEAQKLIETQCKRYGFSNEMRGLLYNTLVNYFAIPDAEKELDDLIKRIEDINMKDNLTTMRNCMNPLLNEEDKHVDIYV